jgi:hypothetical protein
MLIPGALGMMQSAWSDEKNACKFLRLVTKQLLRGSFPVAGDQASDALSNLVRLAV